MSASDQPTPSSPTHGRIRPTRRTFVRLLGAGIGVNLFASGTLDPFVREQGRFASLVISALQRRLAGLGFAAHDYERFAKEYCHRPPDEREARFALLWPLYRYTDVLQDTQYAPQIENWEERVITEFLLGSNYFDAGRTSAPCFVTRWIPQKTPCANPFARHRRSPLDA